MTQTRPKEDSAKLLIASVILLMLVFASGGVVGKMMSRERRDAEQKRADPEAIRTSTRELAVCRKELAAQSTASAAPSVASVTSKDEAEESVDPVIKVELLKEELEQRDIDEVTVRADICKYSQSYLYFMMILPNNPESCIAKEEIADLLDAAFEVCADLTIDTKVYFDIMELPEKDQNRITGGFNHYSRKQKEDYATWRKIIIDKCLKETGQLDN